MPRHFLGVCIIKDSNPVPHSYCTHVHPLWNCVNDQNKYVVFLNTLQNFVRYKNLNRIELNEDDTGENKINSEIEVLGT